jgi:hypothetical protein
VNRSVTHAAFKTHLILIAVCYYVFQFIFSFKFSKEALHLFSLFPNLQPDSPLLL